MIANDPDSRPALAEARLPAMKTVLDRMISLLVIEIGLPAGMPPTAEVPGKPGLRFTSVPSLEQAAVRFQHDAFDALLVDRCHAADMTGLKALVADLPILMVATDDGIETACDAIAAGADDVLLPSELGKASLERRITLAIARKTIEQQRLRHVREDELTGLATAALLEERFIRALARADRFATLVGLVAIDLDGFDGVVARHTQGMADRLLATVARRLHDETRETDTLARTRDHGFTWLVEGLPAIGDISALVDRLPQQLARPFSIEGLDIRLTASVGIAICPFHGRDFQTVHGMAEAAMLDVSGISGDALLMPPVPRPTRSAALT